MFDKFRKFLPLISVFGFVILSTSLLSIYYGRTTLISTLKIFMGIFFLTFGGFKAYNLEGFKEAFESYDIIAGKSSFYGTAYPFMEIGLGISYIFLIFYSNLLFESFIHLSAFLLMFVGAAGVFRSLIRGTDLKCACLGNVFNVPMTKVTLVEDLGMGLMALWMFLRLFI